MSEYTVKGLLEEALELLQTEREKNTSYFVGEAATNISAVLRLLFGEDEPEEEVEE